MNVEFLNTVYTLVIAGGTGFFGWFFGRRRAKAEAKTVEIDNDIKLSNQYKEVLDDLKNRYEEKYQELETRYNTRYNEYDSMMQRKVSMLEEEIKLKDRKLKLQQQEIVELKREIRDRDKKIKELQRNGSDSPTRTNAG